MRAVARIEEMAGGRFRIIVTEIPYQINKTTLLERIAELVREGRITDISDLRDESDRKGMRIVIELKRGAAPRKVLNQLFKYTPLQTHLRRQHAGAGRRRAAAAQPEARAAASTSSTGSRSSPGARSSCCARRASGRTSWRGCASRCEFLDEVIRIIRGADSAEAAKATLIARFALSERQAQAILDMQLRRLAALERQKIEDEYQALLKQIAEYEALLADPARILALVARRCWRSRSASATPGARRSCPKRPRTSPKRT